MKEKIYDLRVWYFIIASSFLQALWGITLKKLNFQKIIDDLGRGEFFNYSFLIELIPLIIYFVLGFLIVLFISKAYKILPMSMVYAFWMGLTIVFQTLIDVFYFTEKISAESYCFIALILIGIIGMKKSETKEIF